LRERRTKKNRKKERNIGGEKQKETEENRGERRREKIEAETRTRKPGIKEIRESQ
jgi:hypothetical protein